jgi:hypothetical protein
LLATIAKQQQEQFGERANLGGRASDQSVLLPVRWLQ